MKWNLKLPTEQGNYELFSPTTYGNKDPWTNRKCYKMGHLQDLAHPREQSPLPLVNPRSHWPSG